MLQSDSASVREQQRHHVLVGGVIRHAHNHPGAGVPEVALKGQPTGEGYATKDSHDVLCNAYRSFRADHFGLHKGNCEVVSCWSKAAAAACNRASTGRLKLLVTFCTVCSGPRQFSAGTKTPAVPTARRAAMPPGSPADTALSDRLLQRVEPVHAGPGRRPALATHVGSSSKENRSSMLCPPYRTVHDGKMRISAVSRERHVRRCQSPGGRAPRHLGCWRPPGGPSRCLARRRPGSAPRHDWDGSPCQRPALRQARQLTRCFRGVLVWAGSVARTTGDLLQTICGYR